MRVFALAAQRSLLYLPSAARLNMTVEYTVIEKMPSAEAFCHLRVAAGMSPRPEGARAGLPHSCYGVHILWQETPIAMGRIVGDGAISILSTSPSIRLTRKRPWPAGDGEAGPAGR